MGRIGGTMLLGETEVTSGTPLAACCVGGGKGREVRGWEEEGQKEGGCVERVAQSGKNWSTHLLQLFQDMSSASMLRFCQPTS